MSVESSLNFRRVSETVTTSGTVAAEGLAELKAKGYDLVVNLLPDSSEYAVGGEAAIVAGQGVDYVYIPIDFATPNREQFEAFAAAMDANAEKVVHVHCAANYRVSSFVALYHEARLSWSPEQSDAHMRRIWEPNETWSRFIADERARQSTRPPEKP